MDSSEATIAINNKILQIYNLDVINSYINFIIIFRDLINNTFGTYTNMLVFTVTINPTFYILNKSHKYTSH